ncbi:caspase family protein [Rhodobacteraceae bacterium N5(2021)]|uniref:Caspase family protein n=1 Tax=Gymnodinialimonas phycosphaerae TaxID=2841589 RepID=A0A975TWL3_9RHOB|nr:caspase family protein [Gymnodinialimonas phycosphaerae]MBY4892021.1 caspase family protein [Gymnodinialimonas phycosphaerae]
MFAIRLLCAAIALALAIPNAASAQERHALVIGINAYDNLGSLEKAVNDGRAMADSLERAGFTVDAGYDLSRRDFVLLLTRFLDRLGPDDEALVFYAGHAVAIENRNFLVPADASALEQSSEALIIAESIGQEFILDQITATGVRLSVVIMDACRNNPFEGLSTRSLGRDAGLAITQPPRGVFMMYSADEGQTALDRLSNDDPHPNSVFTRTLLPLIEEPGIDIVDIARRLRGDVQALAAGDQHQQFPVYRDRMQGGGQFVINRIRAVAEQPAPVTTPPGAAVVPTPMARVAPPVAVNPCVTARADWALLGNSPSVAVLQAYRAAHSGCPLMMTLASDRLAALITLPQPVPQPIPQTVQPSIGANPVGSGA